MKKRNSISRQPKTTNPVERFIALSDKEKAAQLSALEKYDRANPHPSSRGKLPDRELTPAERELWAKAKRGRGRPRLGAGVAKVSVSVDSSLLEQADAYAKLHDLNRSELFSQGLKLAIAG